MIGLTDRRVPRTVLAVALALTTVALATARADAQQILRGSEASVQRMYQFASRNNFEFFASATAIRNATREGTLVELKPNRDFELHDVTYPFVFPEVKLFVDRLASQYRASCGEKLVVTSATRPQTMRLANASDYSVHATGMAVDVRSRNIPVKCQRWLREVLEHLERSGVIEATEENRPPHFHIAVFPTPYKRYVDRQNSAVVIAEEEESSGPSDEPEVQYIRYQVRSGDSLWRIANRHDTTIRALQDVNRLKSDVIKPGQTILVPSVNSPK